MTAMKFLRSNIREIITLMILIPLMLFGLDLLGDRAVAESGPLSSLVSLGVGLLGGVLKFGVCLVLIWAGLGITFPEAGGFSFGRYFDSFWNNLPAFHRGMVSLAAAGVLGLMAAICMSA